MSEAKIEKLEHKIKDLNAIMGEYRTEVDEAESHFKKRKITKEEYERIKTKCEEKMGHLTEKIKDARNEIHELRAEKSPAQR